MTIVRSSNVPGPRQPNARGEEPALPDAEETSWDETYDDASEVAQAYPVRRIRNQAVADQLLADTRWQEICETISTPGALGRHYLD